MIEELVRQVTAFQQIIDNLDADVLQWLKQYDAYRQSWTAEDG